MASSIDKRQRQDHYVPLGVVDKGRKDAIEARKTLFGEINRFVMSRNGWITSIAGADTVTLETLPGSPLPEELIALGYDVRPADPPTGERIISGCIIERFVRRADGELEPATPESTKPIASLVTHSGICKTSRFTFPL